MGGNMNGTGAFGGAGQSTAGGGASSTPGGGANSTGGVVDTTNGGPKLRVLTQSEYMNSLTDVLGAPVTTALTLPPDTFISGFTAVGAAEVTINASAVEQYETAGRAAAAEVFADPTRWQKFVGCQPKADLSDACVTTFLKTAGKRAFRRDLTDAEVTRWLQVGKDIAQASTSATQGLLAITTGLIQSPYFLYRVETNAKDASGRLKYDGLSMATRLSYLLTGHPPSDAMLTAAAAGQLDTADGVKAVAAPLLADASKADAIVERMARFFNELSADQLVNVVQKSPDMFPNFDDNVRNSALQATQMFIKNVVLAPGADVRTLFDSNQTYVDANLAPIYGVPAPTASGFQKITLGPETGRAGILGQVAVIAGHSQSDHNSPTKRGLFLLETFLCRTTPPPPAGVITTIPDDPSLTARQRLEQHRANPSCASCHAFFDPLGFAFEHFDAIGKYRATEGTLAIDATGTVDGATFDGAAQFGAALRQDPKAITCMMNNFYRSANGSDPKIDSAQIDALTQSLAAKGYVWRDFLAQFIVSDAFRSAPAVATTAGNQ